MKIIIHGMTSYDKYAVADVTVKHWWWPFGKKHSYLYITSIFGEIGIWDIAPWFTESWAGGLADQHVARVLTVELKKLLAFDKSLGKAS